MKKAKKNAITVSGSDIARILSKEHYHLHSYNGRMAAFGEPKPELKEVFDPDNKIIIPKWPHKYNKVFNEWQESFSGYMKEPEFKVGDVVYCWIDGCFVTGKIKAIHGDGIYMNITNGIDLPMAAKKKRDCSHYHEGQQLPREGCRFVMKEICEDCGGDGKDTCNNPDHGFIEAMPGEIGRLGCPVCGHDEDYKVPNGGDCEICNGTGIEWQEAKEPSEDDPHYMKSYYSKGGYLGKEFDRKEYEQDKTKFQQETRDGTILIEEIE